MVTGIEAAGLALAILPLILNQADSYVQGLERLKMFGSRRYRREMKSYYNSLSTQQSILQNVLEQCLEGIIDYEEDLSELINHPLGSLWKDQTLETKLSKKLGRDYNGFSRTMTELAELLEEFSKKLGISITSSTKTPEIVRNDSSIMEREIKKIKDIISQSIYSDYINKIKSANATLQTLVEQSIRREKSRKNTRLPKRQLMKFTTAWKLAHSLYDLIVGGKCWKCQCQDQHGVQIQLNILSNMDAFDSTELPKFRIVFSSRTATQPATSWYWQEVETEPVVANPPIPEVKSITMEDKVRVRREPKVKLAVVTSTLQSVPSPQIGDIPSGSPISDMCTTLSGLRAKNMCEERKLIGFLSDQSHRYILYVVGNSAGNLQLQSLEELLISSSNSMKFPTPVRTVLTRRNRLWLAASLACSVLQFHGSWLKAHWRTRDILFMTSESQSKDVLDHPFLSQQISGNPEESDTPESHQNCAPPYLIRNEILFPLGLVLVELSLCQTIASLRTPEDDDRVEAVANLKTATRLLPDVRNESGMRYEEVVDKCLFWPGKKDIKFDDEEFQKMVFDSIILPLLDDLRDFEGRS